MAYSTLTILTNKELEVGFKGELEGAKDSALFSMPLKVSDTFEQISNLNIDSLKEYYSNSCIADGLQISVGFKKNRAKKNGTSE